jgi:DNA-binding LacI/PurR family transcriptional regulator
VVHGAEELLREEGYDLLLYTVTGEPAARQRLFNSYLLSKRVDAVMVLALRPTPAEVASLDRTGSPKVVVGGSVPGWSCVRIDDIETAATAVRHLVELGHTQIAHLGGVPDPEHAGLDFSTPGDRQEGYRLAMAEAGLRIEPAWEVTGDFSALGGLAACRQLLASGARPTAIFAGSDEMAIGAAHAVREAGLKVPDDMSVIGIDNHELSEYFDLSTIAQPAPELGRLGARRLLDALRSETAPEPVETIVPTQLIARGTTARLD